MKAECEETFLRNAEGCGIILDKAYSPPYVLSMLGAIELRIDFPKEISKVGVAVSKVFDLLDTGAAIWLWRRGGAWKLEDRLAHVGVQRDSFRDSVRVAIRRLGVIDGATVLHIAPDEIPLAKIVVLLNTLVSRGVSDDLFLVPADFSEVVYIDHHDCIFWKTRDENRVKAILARLATLGIASKVKVAPDKGSGGPESFPGQNHEQIEHDS